MRLTERQNRLLEVVRTRAFASLEALAEEFGVSTQTVRRDVIRLSEAGLLQRFHGGAGISQEVFRLGHSRKRGLAASGKRAVATRLAGAIAAGSSVFLDVGTSVEPVAELLRTRADLRVVTTSMRAALLLGAGGGPEVVVPGGRLRGTDGAIAGGETCGALRDLALDVAVIACSGFDAHGAPEDFDGEKIAVKRAAMDAARTVWLVADRGKHARRAFQRIAPVRRFDALFTDRQPPATLTAAWQRAGREVLCCDER